MRNRHRRLVGRPPRQGQGRRRLRQMDEIPRRPLGLGVRLALRVPRALPAALRLVRQPAQQHPRGPLLRLRRRAVLDAADRDRAAAPGRRPLRRASTFQRSPQPARKAPAPAPRAGAGLAAVVGSMASATVAARTLPAPLHGGDVWLHAANIWHLVDAFAVYAITLVGGRHAGRCCGTCSYT